MYLCICVDKNGVKYCSGTLVYTRMVHFPSMDIISGQADLNMDIRFDGKRVLVTGAGRGWFTVLAKDEPNSSTIAIHITYLGTILF